MATPNESKKMPLAVQQTKPVVDSVPIIDEGKDSVISRFNDFRMRIDQIKLGIHSSPSLEKPKPQKFKSSEDLARIQQIKEALRIPLPPLPQSKNTST